MADYATAVNTTVLIVRPDDDAERPGAIDTFYPLDYERGWRPASAGSRRRGAARDRGVCVECVCVLERVP